MDGFEFNGSDCDFVESRRQTPIMTLYPQLLAHFGSRVVAILKEDIFIQGRDKRLIISAKDDQYAILSCESKKTPELIIPFTDIPEYLHGAIAGNFECLP